MLTQCFRSVGPEIVVEIPEPWFQHPNSNPGLSGSGRQSLYRATPRWIAIDGNVEALQSFMRQDGSEVGRRECRPDRKPGGRFSN